MKNYFDMFQVNFNCVTTHSSCFIVVVVLVLVVVVIFLCVVSVYIVAVTVIVIIFVGPRNLTLKFGQNRGK